MFTILTVCFRTVGPSDPRMLRRLSGIYPPVERQFTRTSGRLVRLPLSASRGRTVFNRF